MARMTTSERAFLDAWKEYGPDDCDPVHQYKTEDCVTPKRKQPYKWDFAWPNCRVLLEVQGFGGGHQFAGAMHTDFVKHRRAMAANYLVIPVCTACLDKGRRQDTIHEVMSAISAMGRFDQ